MENMLQAILATWDVSMGLKTDDFPHI